jgi:integrase
MATKAGNPDQYLQKVGGTYYARVRVPRTLEKYTHQTHIRKSLETGDRAQANLRKHAVVGQIKAELARLRKNPKEKPDRGISFAQAKEWREELITAQKLDDDGERAHIIQGLVVDKAEEVERLYGTEKASRWYKAATTTTDTLKELMDGWMRVSDYKESTKAGHRKALSEVLEFVKNEHAAPADVTRTVAISYLDTDLTQKGLAHSTIRDRLVSLGGFWSWMESRAAVPKGVNPWTGHKISKQNNKGRSPPKRAYTDDELCKLLAGNDKVKKWPTYSYLPDLILIGLYTGAREDELCSLLIEHIEMGKSNCIIKIADSKTKAGIRFVGITHPIPLGVIRRRIEGKSMGEQLFNELTRGGLDEKLSSSAVKAYGRYRRACGVPDGTDFHSYRRNVITVLENAGVGQVPINRYVGHKVGTLAADTYSEGGYRANSLKTSRKVRFGQLVEAAALLLASNA